ncbi:tail tape measure protein [Altericroceibacterium spongiae]|uniref:Tail tape measure protein n=1 Tax=Altericroceibacterium spongiae TaxID=2320269 RepID=A0A420EIU0_9SPHN|nr:tail tape measure protein [Altericroceibacterium spongiae]RKF20577.1 tail tape measure protein [Altericroceibacterium spongiae]
MDDEIETLLVDVRASTQGFRTDIETMRGTLDTTLVDGFAKAGDVLESGLLRAIRRGHLGFDDLKRAALTTMSEIAAQAVQSGIGSLFGDRRTGPPSPGSAGGLLTSAIGGLLGLPGRATGGPVAPGQAYMVGERGPEVFVPTSAGRVETPAAQDSTRKVSVGITIAAPRGSHTPAILQRSSRQVASSVRRALSEIQA